MRIFHHFIAYPNSYQLTKIKILSDFLHMNKSNVHVHLICLLQEPMQYLFITRTNAVKEEINQPRSVEVYNILDLSFNQIILCVYLEETLHRFLYIDLSIRFMLNF